jgi:hypothetical protein
MSRPTHADNKYILWGAYCSLYTGKVRAYLIKKGIEYIEIKRPFGRENYAAVVL